MDPKWGGTIYSWDPWWVHGEGVVGPWIRSGVVLYIDGIHGGSRAEVGGGGMDPKWGGTIYSWDPWRVHGEGGSG